LPRFLTGGVFVTVVKIKQLSKKDYLKKKANLKEASHWEGKYFCNCRTRNIRKWLGVKRYGYLDLEE